MAENQPVSSKYLLLKWLAAPYVLLVVLLFSVVGPINQKVLWISLLLSPLFVLFLFIYFYLFEFIYMDDTSFWKGAGRRKVSFNDIESLMYYGIRNSGFIDIAILFHGGRATTVSLMLIPDKEEFFEKFPWAKFHEATKGILQKRPPPT